MTGAMNIGRRISESTRFLPQTSSCTSRAMAMPRTISNPTVATKYSAARAQAAPTISSVNMRVQLARPAKSKEMPFMSETMFRLIQMM